MKKTKEEILERQRVQKRNKRLTDPEFKRKEKERNKKWSDKNKQYLKEYYKRYRKEETEKWKSKVYELLGKKCVKCGYDKDIRALQVDHINGGGREHHKKHSNYTFYKDVIASNGVGYQILCANCNIIKKFENNELPRNQPNSIYALKETNE